MATAAKSTNNSMFDIGSDAPNFSMPTDGGGHVNLKDLGGKHVVLYFYPKDDTPGCTVEAKDFRDLSDEFSAANAVVIGVSKDSTERHDKFKNKYDLNFTLATDETGETCEAYGVWIEKNMYGKKYMGIQRATFLIDANGKIAAIWPKVKVKGHAAEVLETLQKL